MSLWSEFKKLKTSIPGNREKTHYEETYGMPREEFMHITMPNKYNRRIISELEFAIRLSETLDGKFDSCIGEAIAYLLNEIKEEGVLSKTACFKAEEIIMPCKDSAKEYKLLLCGHAHIDMNWLWGYQETVAITLSTFRTVLNLMKQYPTFKFSQSQAACYQIVEEYDPDLIEEIKERIAEGRWEVTASAWVETDKNMPNTESLLRHIRYTKSYLKNNWGIDPDKLEVDFSPDTFGHSTNIPEINNYGGVKYYYHCRGNADQNALYRWKAPSGKEILIYKEQYWYNSGITPHIATGIFDISKRSAGFKTGLIVYGVGDHGGGPTRRDIERALEMMEWPVYPTIEFSTFHEFFHEAESIRDQLPVVEKELNFIFRGCYTTQSRIKKANRKSEAVLTDAEALMAFAQAEANKKYSREKHEKAWQNVLFTHFHDIITGSCIQDSREHAMGLYANTIAYANTQYQKAATVISEMTDTSAIEIDNDIENSLSEGAGGGFNMNANSGVPSPERGCGKIRIFNIFNPVAIKRNTLSEITVWDWVGDMRLLTVEDVNGNPIKFQLLNGELATYWDHKFFKILVDTELPSLGYKTIIIKEKEATNYPVYLQGGQQQGPKDDFVMENGLVRVVIDRQTACVKSFIDLENGVEYIEKGKEASFLHITMERDTCDGWQIGRYLKTESINAPIEINSRGGSLRKSVAAKYNVGKQSKIEIEAILEANSKAIKFKIKVDWGEVAGETIPLLTFNVPFSFRTDKYLFDVPAGSQYRAPQKEDLPGLQYAAAIKDDGTALALIPDSKYGYRTSENEFAVTLINTSRQNMDLGPDPYPDRNQHEINIALVITKDCPKLIEETATIINHATYYVPTGAHKGSLPTEMSFMEFDANSSVISAILPSENGGEMSVRFYETCGKDDNVKIKLAKTPKSAICIDLNDKILESDVAVKGNEISVSVRANCIGTIKITY